MTPDEKAEKREAVIQAMVDKGHTRERAEEVIGLIAKTLFGPGGRFAEPTTRAAHTTEPEEK